jgi:hypothetical protein
VSLTLGVHYLTQRFYLLRVFRAHARRPRARRGDREGPHPLQAFFITVFRANLIAPQEQRHPVLGPAKLADQHLRLVVQEPLDEGL